MNISSIFSLFVILTVYSVLTCNRGHLFLPRDIKLSHVSFTDRNSARGIDVFQITFPAVRPCIVIRDIFLWADSS